MWNEFNENEFRTGKKKNHIIVYHVSFFFCLFEFGILLLCTSTIIKLLHELAERN